MPKRRSPAHLAKDARINGILNMAFDLASMARAFEAGTKKRFVTRCRELVQDLTQVKSASRFNALHDAFCMWGTRAIRSSRTGHGRASYGQIAKTLNVMLKAAVYYCDLPTRAAAKRLIPWLHPAIDTPMMQHLKDQFAAEFPTGTQSISHVDRPKYFLLLDLAARASQARFGGDLSPVHWDDVVWGELTNKN